MNKAFEPPPTVGKAQVLFFVFDVSNHFLHFKAKLFFTVDTGQKFLHLACVIWLNVKHFEKLLHNLMILMIGIIRNGPPPVVNLAGGTIII